jgi:purine-nucleoside phosphorylase
MSIEPATLQKAADWLAERLEGARPHKAVICGSGWGEVTRDVEILKRFEYQDIPGLGQTGVVGHTGELVLAACSSSSCLLFKGRRHFYEGVGWTPIAIPVYLALQSGGKEILLTNSAGAVHPDFGVGDLMCITDHLNLMGDNPLVGEHQPGWGPRFPDLSHLYQRDSLEQAAKDANITLREGVYAATRGPVYETPAEVQAWKRLGADAVGMSTVPEAILAHAAGLKVSGVSCMTNFAAGISPHPLSHEEVTASTRDAMPRMRALVNAWLHLPV